MSSDAWAGSVHGDVDSTVSTIDPVITALEKTLELGIAKAEKKTDPPGQCLFLSATLLENRDIGFVSLKVFREPVEDGRNDYFSRFRIEGRFFRIAGEASSGGVELIVQALACEGVTGKIGTADRSADDRRMDARVLKLEK